MLIGTHADLDPRSRQVPLHQYQDEIMDLDVIQAFKTRTGATGHAVGSMQTRAQADALVRRAVANK